MRKLIAIAAASGALVIPLIARAQDEGALDAADSGDTAWLLAASALVLIMVMPGLALFYGARGAAKNFLSVAAQIGAVAAICSLLWVLAGYTIAFGSVSNGWLGGGNAWMLIDLGNVRGQTSVPESAYVLFEMALAVLAPALIVGAWAGRAHFAWVIAFAALWSLMVYAPIAHWIWGGGWLVTRLGTLDYAGGLVVHTAAGVSGLIAAMLMGKRSGFAGSAATPPHASGLAMSGAAMLWAGLLALSGGAALAANDDAAAAIINSHVAACAAALVWLVIEKIAAGKPSAIGFATGAIAGLAAVSPAAAFIAPGAAMVFGAGAALLSYPAMVIIRKSLAIDDAMGVFAVHGVSGMFGALLLAVFIDPALGGTGYADGMGLLRQIIAQAAGVGAVAAWSAIGTVIAALMVSTVLPMRVTEDEEREGLDIVSHGERAWGE